MEATKGCGWCNWSRTKGEGWIQIREISWADGNIGGRGSMGRVCGWCTDGVHEGGEKTTIVEADMITVFKRHLDSYINRKGLVDICQMWESGTTLDGASWAAWTSWTLGRISVLYVSMTQSAWTVGKTLALYAEKVEEDEPCLTFPIK